MPSWKDSHDKLKHQLQAGVYLQLYKVADLLVLFDFSAHIQWILNKCSEEITKTGRGRTDSIAWLTAKSLDICVLSVNWYQKAKENVS